MDFVFELLFELIFDSTIEIARNAKVSKWVRYPSIVLISLFILGIIVAVGYAGVYILIKHEDSAQLAAGFVLVVLDALLILSCVRKVFKQVKKHKPYKYKRDNL